jgi:hypothetical protein
MFVYTYTQAKAMLSGLSKGMVVRVYAAPSLLEALQTLDIVVTFIPAVSVSATPLPGHRPIAVRRRGHPG